MEIALKKANGLLSWSVVAEGNVNVGIDKARNRNSSGCVNYDVASLDILR